MHAAQNNIKIARKENSLLCFCYQVREKFLSNTEKIMISFVIIVAMIGATELLFELIDHNEQKQQERTSP